MCSLKIFSLGFLLSIPLFVVGCNKPDKLEANTKEAVVVSSTDNNLTSLLKSEILNSNDGQKFYETGVCMGLASMVFKEEVHNNDEQKKLLIANKVVQLGKAVDFGSINQYVQQITMQKCGDFNNQSNDNSYNQCIEGNISSGIKGWIKGVAAPKRLIAIGQLKDEDIFDQFNIYCGRFF